MKSSNDAPRVRRRRAVPLAHFAAAAALGVLSGCPVPEPAHETAVLEIPQAYRAEPERKAHDWFDSYTALAPGDRRLGLERAILLVRVAQAFLEEFEIDPASREFIDRLDGGFLEFDVHELYRSFPIAEAGARREVIFVGRLDEDRYRFGLAQPADLDTLRPGDIYSRIRLTPIARGALGQPAYDLDGEMGVHTGEVGGAEMLAFLTETLRGVETVAAGPAGEGEVSGRMGPEDWLLLASLERDYPRTYAWIAEFFQFEDLISKPDPAGPLRVSTRFGPRIAAFEGKYPRLFSVLSSKDFSFRTSGLYVDGEGKERIRHGLDSRDYMIRASAVVEDGAVLPMDRLGGPAEGEPFVLTEGMREGEAVYDVEAFFRGLHLILVGLRGDVQLAAGEEGFVLGYRFRSDPRVARIEGKLYGVIPDWLMMVDFDDLFRSLLATVVHGRGGRGTEVSVSWRRQSAGANLVRFRVQSELPAEGVLRYAYKFWKRRFLPSFGPAGERRRFQNRFLSNAILDLSAAKEATGE